MEFGIARHFGQLGAVPPNAASNGSLRALLIENACCWRRLHEFGFR